MTHHRTPALALAALVLTAAVAPAATAQDHPASRDRSGQGEHPASTEHPAEAADILAVAAEAGNCGTFVAAVEAAGLTERFRDDGPFTVFVPTDAAFAELPDGAVETLMEPANKARLAGILADHVVPGKIMKDAVKTMKATSVSGRDLDVVVSDDGVTVDGARVVEADLEAVNGVVHLIDAVIMPADGGTTSAPAQPKDHPAH